MWSQLFDGSRCFLALETAGDAAAPGHHYGSTAATIFVWAALLVYAYRCFAESEDRRVLVYKWIASGGLILVVLLLFYFAHGFYFILPMVILSFVWVPNLVNIALRPLTGIFDGGADAEEVKPFYFIAAAKRKKGLHQEAIEEVRRQLEKFPNDVAGKMLLASIEAEDRHDLPAAQATLNDLLQQTDLTPQQRVTALHTLADWQLQLGRDAAAARESLERIVRALPDSQYSHAAEQRIVALDGFDAARDFRENARFEVRPRERDIGLRQAGAPEPGAVDASALASQYVSQLTRHPADTDTREKLAVLYAENFGRLDLAADQLEEMISLPEETPKHVTHWLNLLATLHISVANDEANARKALMRIVEKFPKSANAEVATMRLATLRNEMRLGAATVAKKLGDYDKYAGLKKPAG